MRRSVLAALGLVFLAASPAIAQFTGNNYFLALPPGPVGRPPKPPPAPESPNGPFAAARNVQLGGMVRIDKEFKLLGPWAPLWLGSKAVALLGTRHGQITMLAWSGDHFASSRVMADPAAVGGGQILDMAVSRDGNRLAIVAGGGDRLQIWLRDTQSAAPAAMVATIDGRCEKAGLAWLDPGTLAVGAQLQPGAQAPGESPIITPEQMEQPAASEPTRSLYIVQLGQRQAPASLDLECIKHLDPTALTWSPDGHYAVGRSDEPGKWTLVDRAKAGCEAINMPGIVPAGFIDWEDQSHRFLFTATPANAPDPGHIGVMEYILASHKTRLLASPATAAAYAGGDKIAVLGSQRLNALAMAANAAVLFPAEIAWIDPGQSQLDIVPTGFSATGAELLHAHLTFSAAKSMLAASFLTPNPKGAFAVLMWLSTAAHDGGVLGTGRMGNMLASWSPDGSKLAILAGLPDHPTLAIVAAQGAAATPGER
ncbi:MAG TPA: LpqB family beta-propeller domain-containing protein [Candidatus Binataceae bacterium]